TVFMGSATLQPGKQIQVVDTRDQQLVLQSQHVIVATGARARELTMLPFDGDRVWGYRDALQAKALPQSLVVIGAGAIGMEFASFYGTLGTQVTVVEAASRVLPASDEEVSRFAEQNMA